jgi:uncharacterized protein (UPF0335 family)
MSVIPFKDDADFRKHNQKATEAAAEELRRFVSALEALDMEMADLQRERKDVFTVVRSKGYDVKALRKVVAERKRDAAELAEEREIMALYQQLLL